MKTTKSYRLVLSLVTICLLFSSCKDKFLDKLPDDRVTITTPDQIKKLLVSAYSTADISFLGEFSSDNIVDNNSVEGTYTRFNLAVYKGEVENEVFAWEAANSASSSDGDSPISVWARSYKAIAVANHALEAIEQLEEQGRADEVRGMRAEALMCRAYYHFVLVNVFCQAYKDSAASMNDLGIPYITVPEKTVYSSAERGTVTEVYQKIEADLLAGLANITDNYDQPKYHFNKQASNAFAARFYLYKRDYDKVITYATAALGTNPMSCMRTAFWSKSYSTGESLRFAYVDATASSNFLLVTSNSSFYRSLNGRYACNRSASYASIYGQGPTWQNYTFHPCYQKVQGLYLRGNQDYGLFFPHTGEFFEYTDKVAGIGYVHSVTPAFTGEETLLCRAEAYIMKNDYTHALADLKVWDDARKVGTTEVLPTLTAALIENFYSYDVSRNGQPIGRIKKLNTDKMSSSWVIDTKQNVWLNCVLHFRRIETIHEGLRWFDVKRYGIELTHNIGRDRTETLVWNDPRRAIQIPVSVIQAGMVPNPRLSEADANAPVAFTGSCIASEK